MQLIIYFIQVFAYTGCLALIYQLLLARSTNFAFNRFFLWLVIIAPVVLPFISLPSSSIDFAGSFTSVLPDTVVDNGRKVSSSHVDNETWIYACYFAVTIALFGRLIIQHLKFNYFLKQQEFEIVSDYKTYLNTKAGPGSYWKSIFLKDDYQNESIIAHELAHIRQFHFIDLFVLQLIHAIFWPNLFLYFINRQLKMIHEYQADVAAGRNNFYEYVCQLLAETLNTRNVIVTHQFFHHPIKQRIMMLQKSKSQKSRVTNGIVAAGIALCLVASGIVLQTGCTKESAPKEMVYQFVDEQPQFTGDINNYLMNTLNYPETARAASLEGRVGIKFVVDKNGKVRDATVVRSSKVAALDEEALRAVSSMPNWKPGLKDGKPVNVYFTMPITFKLD